jgi:hypothetical protein
MYFSGDLWFSLVSKTSYGLLKIIFILRRDIVSKLFWHYFETNLRSKRKQLVIKSKLVSRQTKSFLLALEYFNILWPSRYAPLHLRHNTSFFFSSSFYAHCSGFWLFLSLPIVCFLKPFVSLFLLLWRLTHIKSLTVVLNRLCQRLFFLRGKICRFCLTVAICLYKS